jgi:hypothetical protein
MRDLGGHTLLSASNLMGFMGGAHATAHLARLKDAGRTVIETGDVDALQ